VGGSAIKNLEKRDALVKKGGTHNTSKGNKEREKNPRKNQGMGKEKINGTSLSLCWKTKPGTS